MNNLLDEVFDSNYKINEKIRFLEICNHLGTFGSESSRDTESAEKKIKALLSIPTLRTDGLLLLHTVLSQCSSTVFVNNCESWPQYLSKIITGNDKPANKRLAIQCLCRIITYLKPFPDILKKLGGSLIPSVLESIFRLSREDEWLHDSVELLSVCMLYFPGPCGPFKHKIEAFFIKHMDNWSGTLSENIATCVAYLPACGSGGAMGINHSTAWQEQVTQIVTCLNQLVNFMYEGVNIDDTCPAILFSSVELPPLDSSDPVKAIFSAWHRFEILSLCLLKMLSTQFPVPVKVPVSVILSFMNKLFSKNTTMMSKKASLEATVVASVIPALHSIAYNVLEALMLSCRRKLIVHAGTINKLFMKTLKWTKPSENYHGASRPYSMLRVAVYQAMLLWLHIMGSSTGLERHADALVEEILLDVTPEAAAVQLQSRFRIDDRFDKRRTKKKQKYMDNTKDDLIFRKVDLAVCQETCLGALKVLKRLFYSCGASLADELHKKIHNVIVHQLIYLRQGKNLSSSPYSSVQCQKELYAVLLACVVRPSPHWPPPLQISIQIFSWGQLNSSIEISSFCIEALAICTTIIHPRVSILDYSVHSISPAASPSVASEVESNVSILEEANHSRAESISQSAVLHTNKDQHLAATHFKSLQSSKRQPRQAAADIVMLSENESEHYSDEECEETNDAEKRFVKKQTDYISAHQNGKNQVPEGKSPTSTLQQTLVNECTVSGREEVSLHDKGLEHGVSVQKHFSNSYKEECEVSEDEAELVEMVDEEECEDEDEEEEPVDEEDDIEEEEEDIIEDEEITDSIPKHYQDFKLKNEPGDSNGIHVSSPSVKYTVIPYADSTDIVQDMCEIVESEDNEHVESSVTHTDYEAADVEMCTVINISDSPEKVKDLQIGGGLLYSEDPSYENFQEKLDEIHQGGYKPSVSEVKITDTASTNHTEPKASMSSPKEHCLLSIATSSSSFNSFSCVGSESESNHQPIDMDDITTVLESVITIVSHEKEPKLVNSEVPLLETTIDINGCDTTFHQNAVGYCGTPLRKERISVMQNSCVVTETLPHDHKTESLKIVGSVDACSSTCEEKTGIRKHSTTFDDAEEERLSKKQCCEEKDDSELSSTVLLESFIGEERQD